MTFARPEFLLLLPLAAVPLFWRRRAAVRFSSFLVLPPDPLSRALSHAERGLAVLFILAIVLSLAEPRTGDATAPAWREGARLIFVVDQSASMFSPWSGAADEGQRKIDIAREAIVEFVDRRARDQVALIGFGKASILYMPPTFDHARFQRTARLLSTDFGDTLIDIALLRALELLESGGSTAGGQAVILVSDGAGRVRLPEEIAHRFRRTGTQMYWLLIEGGESGDARMERLLRELGPHGRTFVIGEVNELPDVLEAVGRLEERLVRVEEHRPGRRWTRIARAVALGSLLGLGVFALGERTSVGTKGRDG